MIRRSILPAVEGYVNTLSRTVVYKKQACPDASCDMEDRLIRRLSNQLSVLFCETEELEQRVGRAKLIADKQEQAECYRDSVLAQMSVIRSIADDMEVYTPKEIWPFPTYGELLFSIQ